LIIGAAVLAAVTGACVLLADFGDRDGGRAGSIAAPGVRQARWRITTAPAGVAGKLERNEKRRVRAQGRVLSPKIRRLFNAMFLYPKDVRAVVKRLFSASAATALKRSGAGLPRKAKDIKLLRRVAHIGIDASGASRAAAEVRVVAKGVAGDKRFRLQQEANLWLSRQARRWKVIGFEIAQRPWRRDRKEDGGKRNGKKRDSKEGRADGDEQRDAKRKGKKRDSKKGEPDKRRQERQRKRGANQS
jgi:hypothetical protein